MERGERLRRIGTGPAPGQRTRSAARLRVDEVLEGFEDELALDAIGGSATRTQTQSATIRDEVAIQSEAVRAVVMALGEIVGVRDVVVNAEAPVEVRVVASSPAHLEAVAEAVRSVASSHGLSVGSERVVVAAAPPAQDLPSDWTALEIDLENDRDKFGRFPSDVAPVVPRPRERQEWFSVFVTTPAGRIAHVAQAVRLLTGLQLADATVLLETSPMALVLTGKSRGEAEIARSALMRAGAEVMIAVDPTTFPQLTARERDVLRALAAGKSNGEISNELSLSESTVKTHVRHVMQKLGADKRTEAIARAREHDLL